MRAPTWASSPTPNPLYVVCFYLHLVLSPIGVSRRDLPMVCRPVVVTKEASVSHQTIEGIESGAFGF